MKNLILALGLLGSFVTQADNSKHPIFYATVLEKKCDTNVNVRNAKDVCLIVVQSEEDGTISGLVMDGDSYWDGGKYIRKDDPVYVDLTYTVEATSQLKRLFPNLPAKSKIYFHDQEKSYGSFSDVIKPMRRN